VPGRNRVRRGIIVSVEAHPAVSNTEAALKNVKRGRRKQAYRFVPSEKCSIKSWIKVT
jgi:hypothetical protein